MSWTKDALVVLLTLLTWTVFVAKVCWTANIFIDLYVLNSAEYEREHAMRAGRNVSFPSATLTH